MSGKPGALCPQSTWATFVNISQLGLKMEQTPFPLFLELGGAAVAWGRLRLLLFVAFKGVLYPRCVLETHGVFTQTSCFRGICCSGK